jgi:serine/threonine-protein kinase
MSPEQARGKPVDRRTDIWSFGCVLFEALTGRRAFDGETVSDTVAAVLSQEPDWTVLPADTPVAVRSLLRRCLQKDPNRRLHDIADARIELDDALTEPPAIGGGLAEVTSPWPRWRGAYPWGLVAFIALAAVVVLWQRYASEPSLSQPTLRFAIQPPDGKQIHVNTTVSALAVSPDGNMLVYPLEWGLQLHSFRTLETRRLNGRLPFFSPDGRWVAFFSRDQLKKASVRGGSPQVICRAEDPAGGSWGRDDQIVFAASGSLWRVAAVGGRPEELAGPDTTHQAGSRSYAWPQILPGGKAILTTVRESIQEMRIAVISVLTGDEDVLIESGTWARYVPTGHLVFAWETDILAIPFDLERLAVTGHSISVVQGVTPPTWTGQSLFSVSDTGTLAYVPNASARLSRLVWVNRAGRAEPLPLPPSSDYGSPRLSPDGKRLLFTRQDRRRNLWVYDLERQTPTRLTDEQGDEWLPVWTHDAQRVVFDSTLHSGYKGTMYSLPVDGSQPPRRLVSSDKWVCPHSWSPDGRMLAYREIDAETGYDIWMISTDADEGTPTPFLRTRFEETSPMFSPDGRWIAYRSDQSGRDEIYVRPSEPGRGEVFQISNRGGYGPRWSPKGHELFYRSEDRLMSVAFRSGDTPEIGTPRILFTGRYQYRGIDCADYDVSPDGERFVMIELGESRPIFVVINWFEELKAKMGDASPTKEEAPT